MDVVKSSIIKASLATLFILSMGLLVGLQVDDARGNYIKDQLRESDLRMQNFLVTQSYLDESSNNYCRLVESQIPDLSEQNTRIGQNLQSFSGKSISNRDQYRYLVRKYYVNQLRLYNVLSEYKERCGGNTTLIFYFFDESIQSKRQGAVLTEYYREVDNSTYIFSFNLNKNRSSVLELLKKDYQVTDGPAIVINGNETYRSYVPLEQLKEAIRNSTVRRMKGNTEKPEKPLLNTSK
ncbi:MAG: hypothetical protein ABEK10_00450 [Candidatus Nanosalina sp.]